MKPPIGEEEWQAEFDKYRQIDQYRLMNQGMSLAAFKGIFFWEYVHRLLGRLIGLAFALPLAWFWISGRIPAGYKLRLLALFALGGLQGAIGWWMVASGLVGRTEVAPERLAVHLSNALIIMAGCIWTALDLMGGDDSAALVQSPACSDSAVSLPPSRCGRMTRSSRTRRWTVDSRFDLTSSGTRPPASYQANAASSAVLDRQGSLLLAHRPIASRAAPSRSRSQTT
ncbi:MAG: heme A synthase [Phyllobacteriaceae bacterium]|nr:heme A synthase [Phyllobacteriaceae bacterium]